MKAGEEFICPHCGQNSFLKLVPVLEGWTKKGDTLSETFRAPPGWRLVHKKCGN